MAKKSFEFAFKFIACLLQGTTSERAKSEARKSEREREES